MKPLRSSYPTNHILNPAFQYTPAEHTDIRATFAQFAGVINERLDSPLSLQPEMRQIEESRSQVRVVCLET